MCTASVMCRDRVVSYQDWTTNGPFQQFPVLVRHERRGDAMTCFTLKVFESGDVYGVFP